MSIAFCPQCGSLMRPSATGAGKLECPKCGFSKEANPGSLVISTSKIRHRGVEKTIMIDNDRPKTALPRTRDVRCPKCGNDEAEYWILQTRRADEPPTRFYKCVKCGHVWREYE